MEARPQALPFRFFKILMEQHTHTMNLPEKFTRVYGDTLTNPVMLTVPTGTEWQLYIARDQSGRVKFTDGWEEFYSHYQLQFGSCIFFQYHGSGNFAAHIHDRTTCEIPYIRYDNVKTEPTYEDGLPPVAKKGRRFYAGKQCPNTPKSTKARNVVNKFWSNNPFFVMDMTPAKLSARILANVPIFKDNENNEHNVLLRHGTKGWPLKFKRYKNKGTGCLFARWTYFLSECNLNPGQVCLFEITADDLATLDVHVY